MATVCFDDLHSGEEFSASFERLRDAMIEISDKTSLVSRPGAGGLDAGDMEEILAAVEVLRAEAPVMLEWLR